MPGNSPLFLNGEAGDAVLLLGWDLSTQSGTRVIDGVRRYGRTRDWRIVVASSGDVAASGGVAAFLARTRPVGCIVNEQRNDALYPPKSLLGTPAVYFDSATRLRWRGAPSARCDNAAVARMAFRELSAGLPSSFAAVPTASMRRWNAERIATFRELCAKAGKRCFLFPGRRGEDPERRIARLCAWVVRLPKRCAVFAANDNAAIDVADALAAAGRAVPRDNTIIGVDGGERASEGGDVSALSSVKIDREEAGYLTAKLLDREIASRAGDRGVRQDDMPEVLFGPLLVVRRKSTGGRGRREPRILEAVEMIRLEACDGLTARDLVARFRGSRNLFERRFREAMGHSVLDEILHVRLRHALDLLSRPDMPISAIAAFSGFSSDRELRQLFLRRFHCSMRDWRRRRFPE